MNVAAVFLCFIGFVAPSMGQLCRLSYPCRTCGYTIIRDTGDCSVYYFCYLGRSYRFGCGRGFVFSKSTSTCVPQGSRYNDCPNAITPPPTTTTTTTTTTERPVIKPNPGQSSCGIVLDSFIVNGQPAEEGSWPWQVSIQLYSGFYSYHYCGGVLINTEWILTAAHCLAGRTPRDYYVILGSNSKTYWTSNAEIRKLDSLFVHPSFQNGGGYPNDIALIKLKEPVVFKEGVAPACMPFSGERFLGGECYITGFGDTAGTGNDNILNEMRIDVIENSRCRSSWGYGRIEDSHICVGDGTSGACRGDSGGPLVCVNSAGRFVLAGITSWGFQTCSQFGYPNVYTRVTSHLQWIDNIMSSNNF